MHNNKLSGQIPSALALMPNTVELHLRGNNWTGCAPRHVWALPHTDRAQGWGVTQCLDDPEEALASFHPRCPLASHIDPYSSSARSRTVPTPDGERHTVVADIYRGVAIWDNIFYTLSNAFTNISAQRPSSYCVFGLVSTNSSRESDLWVLADIFSQRDMDSSLLQWKPSESGSRQCSNSLECKYETPTLVSPPRYSNWLNDLLGFADVPAFWLYGTHEITSGGHVIAVETTRGYNVTSLLWETLMPAHRPARVIREDARQTEIDLTWTTRSGVTMYRIDRSETGHDGRANWDTIADNVRTLPFTDRDLDCGRGYHYVVYGRGTGSTYRSTWGAPSRRVILSTAECEEDGGSVAPSPEPPATPTPLNRPTQLNGFTTGTSGTMLDWEDVTGATSYRIRVQLPTGWVTIPHGSIRVSFNGSSATISGLPTWARSFGFRVKALNSETQSRWSATLTVIRGASPK